MSTILRSEVLGTVSELSKREAQSLLENRLRAVNRGRAVPRSNFNFRRFVEDEFRPFVLSTLKFATRKNYTFLFDKHLLPRFGEECVADNALVFPKVTTNRYTATTCGRNVWLLHVAAQGCAGLTGPRCATGTALSSTIWELR